jgi:hypothetical protein
VIFGQFYLYVGHISYNGCASQFYFCRNWVTEVSWHATLVAKVRKSVYRKFLELNAPVKFTMLLLMLNVWLYWYTGPDLTLQSTQPGRAWRAGGSRAGIGRAGSGREGSGGRGGGGEDGAATGTMATGATVATATATEATGAAYGFREWKLKLELT